MDAPSQSPPGHRRRPVRSCRFRPVERYSPDATQDSHSTARSPERKFSVHDSDDILRDDKTQWATADRSDDPSNSNVGQVPHSPEECTKDDALGDFVDAPFGGSDFEGAARRDTSDEWSPVTDKKEEQDDTLDPPQEPAFTEPQIRDACRMAIEEMNAMSFRPPYIHINPPDERQRQYVQIDWYHLYARIQGILRDMDFSRRLRAIAASQ